MKGKYLTALAALTAVIAVAAIVATRVQAPSGPDAGIGEAVYPGLAARLNAVEKFTVARKEGNFTLVRKGDSWTAMEKSDYPADFEKIRRTMLEIADLRKLEAKTSSPGNYPALEVEDLTAVDAKSTRVVLEDAKGAAVVDLFVGKARFSRGGAEGDGVYVRKAGEAQSWLAKGRLTVDRDVVQWLDRNLVDVVEGRVRQVTVAQADGAKLVVRRDKPSDKDFVIAGAPAERKIKAQFDVNNIGGAFAGVELDEVRKAAEVNFVAGGPYAEAVTFDGLTVRADLAEKDGKTWVRFAARAEPPAELPQSDDDAANKLKPADEVRKEAESINAKFGGWVYMLPNWKIDPMRKKLDDLLESKPS